MQTVYMQMLVNDSVHAQMLKLAMVDQGMHAVKAHVTVYVTTYHSLSVPTFHPSHRCHLQQHSVVNLY